MLEQERAGQSRFHLTELDSQLTFVQKSPFPPFEKEGNRKSPFVKGDLEGFSSAQHDLDETRRERADVLFKGPQ